MLLRIKKSPDMMMWSHLRKPTSRSGRKMLRFPLRLFSALWLVVLDASTIYI